MRVLFISGAEIFFVLFIALMVFGADKLPEIVKTLAKGMRQLRDATDDIKREIQKSADDVGVGKEVKKIDKEINEVKRSVGEVTESVKRDIK